MFNHLERRLAASANDAPIKKGDRYAWTEFGADHSITVRRVSHKFGYADIFVYDNRTRTAWTKRQPLPFPASFKRVAS